MHSVGRASGDFPVKSCSTVQVLPYNFESRTGHKTACYGFDSSGMFLPDQTTAPIPPPLFAGRVSRYRQAADRHRQEQFRCPGRFFREILLQNFRECIRQMQDPPVWRGCPALPQAPPAGCKWFIACLNMTGGRRIVFSGKVSLFIARFCIRT